MKWLDRQLPPAALTCVYCDHKAEFPHVKSFAYAGRDYALFRCPACGSLHYDPPEIVARIEHPYSEAYKENTRIGTKYFLETGYSPEMIAFCALAALAGLPPERLASRQFVDIGAGIGLSSVFVRDVCGIDPVVIEPAYMGELGQELLGLDIQRAFFEHLPEAVMHRLQARPCLLHLNSVVEHLSDPAEPVRQALARVQVETFAAIVPNAEMVDPSAAFTAMLPTLAPGDHLHLPTPDGMRHFMRRLGFEHVEISSIPGLMVAVGAHVPITMPTEAQVKAGADALLRRLLVHPNPVVSSGAAARLLRNAINTDDADARQHLASLRAGLGAAMHRATLLQNLQLAYPWHDVPFHVCVTGYCLAVIALRGGDSIEGLAWLDVVDAAAARMRGGEAGPYGVQALDYGWAARLLRADALTNLARFEEARAVLEQVLAAEADRVTGPSHDQLADARRKLAWQRGPRGLLLRRAMHPQSLLYYLLYARYYQRELVRNRSAYRLFLSGYLTYQLDRLRYSFYARARHAVGSAIRLAPSRLLVAMRHGVAARRDALPVRILAAAARKFLRAIDNAHNGDIASNGEAFLVRTVLPLRPGDVFDVGTRDGPLAALAAATEGAGTVHAFDAATDQLDVFRARCKGQRVRFNEFIPGDLDAYAAAHAGASIALLRIAVPGQEQRVLAGCAGLLAAGRIGAICFAHGPANAASRSFLADIVAPLQAAGMAVFHLLPGRLRACTPPEAEDFAGRLYVALAPGLVQALAARGLVTPKHAGPPA